MTNHLDETAGRQPEKFIQPREFFAWYERRKSKRIHTGDKAKMIEDYIANDMQINDIAKKYDVSYYRACNAISHYFKKLPYSITIMSKA